MLDRLFRGLSIAGASFRVLLAHPQLVIFPLISTTAMGALLLTAGRALAIGHKANPSDFSPVIALLGLYMTVLFITVFFNAALVSCVRDAFYGRPVALRSGFATALSHISLILRWTVFCLTIGLVLAALRDFLRKFGILGMLAGAAAEFSWTIMTYMAVPILVMEDCGPVQCLERSSELVKKNWGTAIGVEAGMGLLYGLSVVPGVVAFLFAFAGEIPLLYVLVASAIYLPIVLASITALDMIFRTGVYVYAVTGQVPPAVEDGLVQGAFSAAALPQ